MNLVFENAKSFNEEGSEIYEAAVKMTVRNRKKNKKLKERRINKSNKLK